MKGAPFLLRQHSGTCETPGDRGSSTRTSPHHPPGRTDYPDHRSADVAESGRRPQAHRGPGPGPARTPPGRTDYPDHRSADVAELVDAPGLGPGG